MVGRGPGHSDGGVEVGAFRERESKKEAAERPLGKVASYQG